jgi:hypothetical protein
MGGTYGLQSRSQSIAQARDRRLVPRPGGEISVAEQCDGGLKAVTVNLGTWNAFHTEIDDFTNLDGDTTSNKWYESDLYATLALGFSKAALSFNYTSYLSPGNYFSHVKEFGIKLGVVDSAALGKGALKPYALVAFELISPVPKLKNGSEKRVKLVLAVTTGVVRSVTAARCCHSAASTWLRAATDAGSICAARSRASASDTTGTPPPAAGAAWADARSAASAPMNRATTTVFTAPPWTRRSAKAPRRSKDRKLQ